MKRNKQWNTLFTIEKNISYEAHMQSTKELSQTALEKSMKRQSKRLSFGALVKKQLKFLAWKIWFLQGMVLAGLYALLLCVYTVSLTGWLVTTIPKFLCCCSGVIVISSIPILKRSIRYRMIELEQSTRFSAAGSFAAQLLFIGIGDLGMLAALAFVGSRHGLTNSVIFVVLIVPFLTTAVTCLMLWSRTPPCVFSKSAVPLCILTTLLMNYIIDQYRQFHFDSRPAGWLLYSLACLVIIYREYRKVRFAAPRT